MIKKNKKAVFLCVFILIICVGGLLIYNYLSLSKDNYNVFLVDKDEQIYLLTDFKETTELSIKTDKNKEYSFVDIQGNIIESNQEYKDDCVYISPKDGVEENVVYLLKVQDNDKLVDEKLSDAKFIYIVNSQTKVDIDKYKYGVKNINIEEKYNIKDGKIVIEDKLIVKMENPLLNRTKDISLKDCKIYLDDNLISNNKIECKKGKHQIKVEFSYNNEQHSYTKEVEAIEVYGGLNDQALIKKAQDLFDKANQTIKDIIYASQSANEKLIMVDDITGKIRTDENASSGNCLAYNPLNKVNNQKVRSISDVKSAFYSLFDKNQKMPNVYVVDGKLCTKFKFGYDGIDNIKVTQIKSKSDSILSFKINAKRYDSSISFEGKLIYKNNQWKVYDFLNTGSEYEYSDY